MQYIENKSTVLTARNKKVGDFKKLKNKEIEKKQQSPMRNKEREKKTKKCVMR